MSAKCRSEDHWDPLGALENSLAKLGLDYVNMYLMHWPMALRVDGRCPSFRLMSADDMFYPGSALLPNESPTYIETWHAMQRILKTGRFGTPQKYGSHQLSGYQEKLGALEFLIYHANSCLRFWHIPKQLSYLRSIKWRLTRVYHSMNYSSSAVTKEYFSLRTHQSGSINLQVMKIFKGLLGVSELRQHKFC